jgi:hypothetical protein
MFTCGSPWRFIVATCAHSPTARNSRTLSGIVIMATKSLTPLRRCPDAEEIDAATRVGRDQAVAIRIKPIGGRHTGSRIDRPSSHSTGRMDSCTSDILLSRLEVDEVAWSLTRLQLALQKRQAVVDMAELADPAAHLGTLGRDRRSELV